MRGRAIAELLVPADDDYFVLKPKQSGFYSTTLATLLDYLGADTLVITGFTTDICVLFTAADAFMRDYRLFVPSDCVAALTKEYNEQALALIRRVLKADVRSSDEMPLASLARPRGS